MSELTDNTSHSRYELEVAGGIVFARYHREPGRLFIDWVEAPPALRGSGAAGRLMTLVAEQARRDTVRITPICGYAAAWLRQSKVYRDLLD